MAASSGKKMKSVKIEPEEDEAPEIMVMLVGETLCKEHWNRVVELVQQSKRHCAACKACKGVERLIPEVKKEIKLEEIVGSSSQVKEEPKEEPIDEVDPLNGDPQVPPILVEENEEHDADAPMFGGDVDVADADDKDDMEADVDADDEDEDEDDDDDDSSSTTTGGDGEMDMDGPDSEEEYMTPSDDDKWEEEPEYEPIDSNAEED